MIVNDNIDTQDMTTTPIPATNEYESFEYEDYMYPGYSFERPVYLYLWEILVIITFVQNLLILSVFMNRKMRNPTNMILSAIAVSDSLTGLVTLPTYIMVYQRYDPLLESEYEYDSLNQSQDMYEQYENVSSNSYPITTSFNHSNDANESFSYRFSGALTVSILPTVSSLGSQSNATKPLPPTDYLSKSLPPVDGYTLTKNLCRGFMFSKYFLSKSFHTISIFLTLFLEIQRYISMAYPYRYETCFNKFRIVKIYCISVFILCPFLHAYHLGSEKAEGGLCQWELSGIGCANDCIYLWIAFIVRHFIPCVTLVIFTLLFIHQLRKGEKSFRRRMDSNSSQYSRRVQENRRISLVVTAVVVVRLIPEIPYSIFLLYNSIDVTVFMGKEIDIETNRIFHMCFEICLVCSFIANFYIYLIVNKSFRKRLYQTVIEPIRKHLSDSVSLHEFPSLFTTRKATVKKTESLKAEEEVELKTIHSDFSDKLVKIKTKFRK